MIGPVHDFRQIIFIVRIRASFDARGIETIQSQDLNRAFDSQMMEFVGYIQVDNIILCGEREHRWHCIDKINASDLLTSVRLFKMRPSTFDSAKYSLYCGRPMSSSHSREDENIISLRGIIRAYCEPNVCRDSILRYVECTDRSDTAEAFSDVTDSAFQSSTIGEEQMRRVLICRDMNTTFSNSCGVAFKSCRPFFKCLRHSPAY